VNFSFTNTTANESNAVINITYDNDQEILIPISGEVIEQSLIESFSFFNNEDRTESFELFDGGTFDLSSFDFANIQVNTTEIVGSIGFTLSGAFEHTQTESFAPYDVLGSNNNNNFTLPEGEYTLLIDIYEEARRNGEIIESSEISFTITYDENTTSTLLQRTLQLM